jgi:hypothetical protein
VSAGYTVDGVRALLGPVAAAALDRNETTPGRRVTGGGSALELLTRLWPLQLPVPRVAAARVLPLESLVAGGVLAGHGDEVVALVDIRPYADDSGNWWVASDLTPGLDGRLEPVPDDHVLGVNAASSTLAQLTVREPASRALDLGTGCGVQALHLARHCDEIVGTDVAVLVRRAAGRGNRLRLGDAPRLRPGAAGGADRGLAARCGAAARVDHLPALRRAGRAAGVRYRVAALPLRVALDVVQEQIGEPGAEDPGHIVLRQRHGLMRARTAGTAEAGFVGACDGALPVGALIGALAAVLGVDEAALRAELLPAIRALVREGYLEW